MLWVPKTDMRVITNDGIVGTTSIGTGVTSGGSANAYGASPTELISAANNTIDTWAVIVMMTGVGASNTARSSAVRIYGGAATEQMIIGPLLNPYTYLNGIAQYLFPLHIPAGTRISADHACVTASTTARVSIQLIGGGVPPWRVGTRVDAIGTQAANSRGATLTAPGQSGAAATVTELDASSDHDYFYFMPSLLSSSDATIGTAGNMNMGIGIGAATEERIGTWWSYRDTSEVFNGPFPGIGVFREVPAGTRITLLCSNSTTNDSGYDALVYGVR